MWGKNFIITPSIHRNNHGQITILINVFVSQCRVLLNLRTSQPFEEVVEDLGQVLKMTGAKRMYTSTGQEVRSFSQLRNEFADMETFYLGIGTSVVAPMALPVGSPVRRSRSRGSLAAPIIQDETSKTVVRQRARSKSRPRILYAPENEIVRPGGGGKFAIAPYAPPTTQPHRSTPFSIHRLFANRCYERGTNQTHNQRPSTNILSTIASCARRQFTART